MENRSGIELPIEAVLFDYGHTLVDFTVPEDALHGVYRDIRERLVREANAELPSAAELVELVARAVTRAVDESYQNDRLVELDILALFQAALEGLGFAPSPETVLWVAEIEHRALSAHLVSPPKTVETLAALKDHGFKIGIVSNAHLLPNLMREDWDNLGFGRYVDASVISCELGVRKPDPRVFHALLQKIGVSAGRCVFVGDRALDDIGGAHRVGMRAILTTEFRDSGGRISSQAEAEAVANERPELIVGSLADILPYVLERRRPD